MSLISRDSLTLFFLVFVLGFGPACTFTCDDGDAASGLDTTGLVDVDDDGFCAGYDCNDEDAAIHPTAEEVCDGIDNDCVADTVSDGEIDVDGESKVVRPKEWGKQTKGRADRRGGRVSPAASSPSTVQ